MRRLYVLGTLDLAAAGLVDGSNILSGSKRLGVLLYLALARPHRFHRRDALLPLFWPELDQIRARHALRQAIYALRSTFGAGIIQGRGAEDLKFDPEALWIDALAFEAALEMGELERALELYAGDFAPGLHISESGAELDQWLELERGWLRQCAADAARRLMERAAAAGEPGGALRWARRLVEVTPEDASAVRSLLRILDDAGEPHEALACYHAWVARIRELWEETPDPDTEALAREIRGRLQGGGRASWDTPIARRIPTMPHARRPDTAVPPDAISATLVPATVVPGSHVPASNVPGSNVSGSNVSRSDAARSGGAAGGDLVRGAVTGGAAPGTAPAAPFRFQGMLVRRILQSVAATIVLALAAFGVWAYAPEEPERLLVYPLVVNGPNRDSIPADALTRIFVDALSGAPELEIVASHGGEEHTAGAAIARAAAEARRRDARYFLVAFMVSSGAEARMTAVLFDRERPRGSGAVSTSVNGAVADAPTLASSLAIRILTEAGAPLRR